MAISQQIRDLEDELGVKLFERTKRQVHLTEAGRVFLDRSYLLLAQLEQAMALAAPPRIAATQQIGRGEVGQLAIGFVDSAMYTSLPEMLKGFREQFSAAGLGIAIVPASMQNFHRSGVIYRPLQEQICQTGLYLAWRQHDSSPIISAFLNLVRKRTRPHAQYEEYEGSESVVAKSPGSRQE